LAKSAQTKIGCVKYFTVKCAHKCNLLRINATFVENKCNFLTFLLQQKLALLITIIRLCGTSPVSGGSPEAVSGRWTSSAICNWCSISPELVTREDPAGAISLSETVDSFPEGNRTIAQFGVAWTKSISLEFTKHKGFNNRGRTRSYSDAKLLMLLNILSDKLSISFDARSVPSEISAHNLFQFSCQILALDSGRLSKVVLLG